MTTQAEPTVRDVPERSRFEISVEGPADRTAGFVQYHVRQGRITLIHTEIADEFEGRGLGSVLIRAALDAARARGLEVRPDCPFVRAYLGRHPEYLDLVPESLREHFDL
jgi:predicted GNAT family acetyltransferase